MNTIEIGKRIKERRQELNLTLQQVADKVKVNKSTIQRYESGNIKDVKLPIIESIANALDVNPLWLIGKITKIEKHSKEYENATYLINVYFNGIMKWSEDKLLSEEETISIREHFYNLLLRYKEMVEGLVYAEHSWKDTKESYSQFYKNKKEPLSDKEIKELYLSQEIKREINNLIGWIEAIPNWMSRRSEELIKNNLNNNVTELIPTRKEEYNESLVAEKNEVYNFAAHDDGLDSETKRKNIEKAKAIFKQMDE